MSHTFHALLLRALLVVFIHVVVPPLAAVDRTWVGEGDDSDFATPENWDPEGVPLPEDNVTIAADGAVAVFTEESQEEVPSVAILATDEGGALLVESGELNTAEVRVGLFGNGLGSITGGLLRCQAGGDEDFRISFEPESEGEFTLEGGEVIAGDDVIIGHFGAGILNQTGGALRGGYTVVANNPGSGGSVWNISGGLFEGVFGDIEVGDDDLGTVNHSGGTVWVNTSLSIGNRTGTGIYNVSGNAVIDCTRGTGDILVGVGRDGNAGGTGVFRISGPDVTILCNQNFLLDPNAIAAEATLVAEITGPQHSTIRARGNAEVTGGRLVVELNGYTPEGGETYILIETDVDLTGESELSDPTVPLEGLAGLVIGEFEEVELPALPGGLEWELEYGEVDIVLNVLGSASASRRLGDCNDDGRLELADSLCILGHLFLGNPMALPCGNGTSVDPGNVALLDANQQGAIDLTDAVVVLQFLFGGGPPPGGSAECVDVFGCTTLRCE